jgi:restriction system protein
MGPVLRALDGLGGSARPAAVVLAVAIDLEVSEEEQAKLLPSKSQRSFDNKVAWARFYLAKEGLVDSSQRGVWSLTESGRTKRDLSHAEALEIFKRQHAIFAKSKSAPAPEEDEIVAPESAFGAVTGVTNFREEFLTRLQGLPPAGFERFARRLLLESGFQEVQVTGKSGDGGIDGIGRLQVNPMVSTKVLFQCKRYVGSVGSKEIRDFRGAMAGRSENRIIITKGSFTNDARQEAIRDGVAPIELVDGVRLVALCEDLRLGLSPVTTFELDAQFFSEFE